MWIQDSLELVLALLNLKGCYCIPYLGKILSFHKPVPVLIHRLAMINCTVTLDLTNRENKV